MESNICKQIKTHPQVNYVHFKVYDLFSSHRKFQIDTLSPAIISLNLIQFIWSCCNQYFHINSWSNYYLNVKWVTYSDEPEENYHSTLQLPSILRHFFFSWEWEHVIPIEMLTGLLTHSLECVLVHPPKPKGWLWPNNNPVTGADVFATSHKQIELKDLLLSSCELDWCEPQINT